jgi:hypothetical protein
MLDPRVRPEPVARADTDLVEYVILTVPDTAAMAPVALALVHMVEAGVVRILDLVVMVRGPRDPGATILELETVESLNSLWGVQGEVGGLFSRHDVELASLTLQPQTAAIMLLLEDRWAKPLATAARTAGGRLASGERIPRGRIDAVRGEHADLLERLPSTGRPSDSRRVAPWFDPAEQILELAALVDRGLLSTDEFERQRSKVLDA